MEKFLLCWRRKFNIHINLDLLRKEQNNKGEGQSDAFFLTPVSIKINA